MPLHKQSHAVFHLHRRFSGFTYFHCWIAKYFVCRRTVAVRLEKNSCSPMTDLFMKWCDYISPVISSKDRNLVCLWKSREDMQSQGKKPIWGQKIYFITGFYGLVEAAVRISEPCRPLSSLSRSRFCVMSRVTWRDVERLPGRLTFVYQRDKNEQTENSLDSVYSYIEHL